MDWKKKGKIEKEMKRENGRKGVINKAICLSSA